MLQQQRLPASGAIRPHQAEIQEGVGYERQGPSLPGWLAFLSPPIALLFALAALTFWRFGVHHYQSTGS